MRGGVAPRYGLPRDARLRERREFLEAQSRGARFTTRHFIVLVRPGRDGSRLGVTASKRVGNSVVRNRWKRLVREAFRHLRPELQYALDVVVIARVGQEPPSRDEAELELRDALGRWRPGGRRR